MFAPPTAKTKANGKSATVPNHALKTGYPIPGRPTGSVAEQVRMLQRKIGNQATLRLLAQRRSKTSASGSGDRCPHAGADPRSTALASRSVPADGATARPKHVQTKTAVNQPGDVHEQEADRVAEQIMRKPEPQPSRAGPGAGGRPDYRRQQPDHQREHSQTERVPPGETGQSAPPAIVQKVLRSSGRPLEPVARDSMEQRFGQDFGRIRIHADAAAASAAAALGAEAFTIGRHIVFGRDRFAPGTAHGKRLVAHELTHTIQQAGTSPYIALRPERKRAAPAPRRSQFDGVLLGTDRNEQKVRVKREVGGTQGYDHRLQAIAVARLANAEPAVVVLGKDGKYHALETTAELRTVDVQPRFAAGGNIVGVHPLPSVTGIGQSRQRMEDLKGKLAVLDQLKDQWSRQARDDPEFRRAYQMLLKWNEERQRETKQQLDQAIQTSAALALGVPESDILQISSLASRAAGKIHIFRDPPIESTGGAHAPLGAETGFEEGRASTIHIDLPEFDKPARPQKILFHEAQHKFDWDFAQEWVRNYRAATGRLFVKSAPEPFKRWLNDQVKRGRLSKADVELITMQAGDASAYTEARANVREFLATLQAGAPDAATRSLVAYAYALKPKSKGGQYASPAPGSQVQAALVKELKTAYEKMPKDMKRQYDAAVAAAMRENPSAWISELDFSKRAGR